jgi:hypothetical protein
MGIKSAELSKERCISRHRTYTTDLTSSLLSPRSKSCIPLVEVLVRWCSVPSFKLADEPLMCMHGSGCDRPAALRTQLFVVFTKGKLD